MKNFNNISEAISWLESQTRFRLKTDLEIVKLAYEKLNINFNKIKKIHIGGTNGKGSTSAFITNVLVSSNYKVGTFASPYLIEFNERIKINNTNIDNNKLLQLINEIYQLNEQLKIEENRNLAFFEMLTLIAFKHFYVEKVDVIVIEVGIGGRLDATNIIDYNATVITSIGYDHMNVLGNSLTMIAKEKLGALKNNGILISSPTFLLKRLFIKTSKNLNANYLFLNKRLLKTISNNEFYYNELHFKLNLQGSFQINNAILSYLTIKQLFNISDENIVKAINETKWPGRFEEVKPNLFLDGAHNISAIKALSKSLRKLFPNKRITIIFSALKDKDIKAMLKIFEKHHFKIILTSFPDSRFESLEKYATKTIKYYENSFQILNNIYSNKELDDVIVVTGSLHFIGYIYKLLNNNKI